MSVYDYQREDPRRYVNTHTWSKASYFFPGVTEHQQKQYGIVLLPTDFIIHHCHGNILPNNITKQLNQKQISILHLIFDCLTIV